VKQSIMLRFSPAFAGIFIFVILAPRLRENDEVAIRRAKTPRGAVARGFALTFARSKM